MLCSDCPKKNTCIELCEGAEQYVSQGIKPKPWTKNKVYFIRADNGLIKIGKSNNPKERLKALQAGSPLKLRIVKTIPGGMNLEQKLHKYFDHLRQYGEWFKPNKELKEFIKGTKEIYLT